MDEENNILKGGTGKKNPFTVPDNYFGSFPERLRQRLDAEQVPEKHVTERVWQLLRPRLALAAAILGFALIGYFGIRTFVQVEQETINADRITEYIDFYQNDYSEYYLISLLDENDLDPDDIYLDETDTYMDYLYEYNTDLDLIISDF
jgi:hypothetical protein